MQKRFKMDNFNKFEFKNRILVHLLFLNRRNCTIVLEHENVLEPVEEDNTY